MKIKILTLLCGLLLASCSTSSDVVQPETTTSPIPTSSDIEFWITKSDASVLLEKQNTVLNFGNTFNNFANIEINDTQTFQSIDGFGYTLTGGSVSVINQLTSAKKQELLQNLFGNSNTSIGINYLRISIGASDLNSSVFSYNDLPQGQTDNNLSQFSLSPDNELIQMLQSILAINPNIKIIATPWSPPVWMKDNGQTVGGSLQPQYYAVYAQYFVKYIKQMQQQGIAIQAVTPQNEPLHPGNNPSMLMTASQQADFIKNHLGPAFVAAGITTKIIVYDHNCDKPEYPLSILNDAAANPFVEGSAFHLYAGDISVLTNIHNSFPNKNIYFTEQWTGSSGSFSGDLKWHLKNVVIGSMRNWSKTALEWNLANDALYQPHTPGGCTECKGAITINSAESYTKNVAYYIVAHASKFVPANSVRIASNITGNLYNVAFKTPSGKIVLVVVNDSNNTEVFNIKFNGKWATATLQGGSVASYIF
ncbi:glycoside hydrolase family 30 beta sandwich domain-containing protein [Flavobacterium branchiophilum]|uniref:Glycoside hydrolase, family 30 n=1 Tax=Flavobacterium branchiophilum (strain FL-15) TaxID=1034807 RepID=G2Z0K3_FLABF|nr:glycoside hydrolase family 30 beta sandwich domain-containing protein [Flavobacterium branchiophilum]CCB69400.1 Glycoside hydrolase precursor, family 30 [Flavobacterium branchiophilum FL-15]